MAHIGDTASVRADNLYSLDCLSLGSLWDSLQQCLESRLENQSCLEEGGGRGGVGASPSLENGVTAYRMFSGPDCDVGY